ncbi:SRPBCC family protein [Aeromicrobium sp. CF3.5]|uniref:SRPBCC family protein n=1 Tax=Aeromicrobium sp. CF3.5 TaxID=3373078 RepID=UPI003EE6F0BE
MDLKHSFSVPASIDETWAAFQDIESVAECFPGAQVTSVEGDSFEGTCKVKLGPIALVYKGSGHFVEKDEATHRMLIEAKGKDKRGNGTAGATVTAQLVDVGGRTEVEVVTDLAITGKPAQFGRGVMQDVSDKLLGLFVDCLQDKVSSGGDAADVAPPPAADPAGTTATPGAPAATGASAEGSTDSAATGSTPPRPSAPRAEPEALDLGATVIPMLAKAYWKQAAAALAAVVVVLGVRRRRR